MITKLKLERLKREIKQGELAKKVGISPQYLALIEKGAKNINPNKKIMDALAEALNTTVAELFYSEN